VWLLIAGRLLTAFSEGIAALALVAIAVKELGGVESGVIVATAAAVGMLTGSFAGGAADFTSPLRVLIVAAVAGTVCAGALAVVTAVGWRQLAVYTAGAFVLSLCSEACSRAETTALVHLVAPEQLPRVFGAMSARTQMAAAAAGLVSGLIIAVNLTLPFAIDALAWAVCVLLSALVLAGYAVRAQAGERPLFRLRELARGYQFVARTPTVLAIVLIGALANLFLVGAGLVIQLDLIARGTSLVFVGFLDAATGAAALVGSIASGWLTARLSLRAMFVLVLAVLAVSVLVCGLSGNVWVMMVALSVAVFFLPSLGVSASTAVARLTPLHMQARVSGASAVISLLSTTVSPAVFGAGYARTNRVVMLAVAAVGTAVAGVASVIALPTHTEEVDAGRTAETSR